MKKLCLAALVAAPLMLSAAFTASAGSMAGVNLALSGRLLGNGALANQLSGIGVHSIPLGRLGGLALALRSNDGHGHWLAGLTLEVGSLPTSVGALPGLPAGPIQLGVQLPALGISLPATGTNTFVIPRIAATTLTLTNNDGAGHADVGVAVWPLLHLPLDH